MFCQEIYTGRDVRASIIDIPESSDSFQLLPCDNYGHRKSLPYAQIFPDREAPLAASENTRKERNVA
jgi:hypothetical protein